MSDGTYACDHQRGMPRSRSTAITVCGCCRDYLCSICGSTIAWYEGLRVTNPPVQWRYCTKAACIEAEAAYHALSVDVMMQQRDALRAKRVLAQLQDRGLKPRPSFDPPERRVLPGGAERIKITPRPFVLDVGEACWCNRGKDCTGDHEIYLGEPVHRCGICGQTFEIKPNDPHWITGRGPICPTPPPEKEPA